MCVILTSNLILLITFSNHLYNLLYYVDDLAWVAMKGAVSCENSEVGAYFL